MQEQRAGVDSAPGGCALRTYFHSRSRRHLSRQPLYIARRSGHALRPLPETATMRIITVRGVRNHFHHVRRLRDVHTRTTRPSRSRLRVLGVMMCGVFGGHVRGHFMPRTHMSGVHGEHRRHRHFGPSRNDHKQNRCYRLLPHTMFSLAECWPPPRDANHSRV
jgi:hypothetical protein